MIQRALNHVFTHWKTSGVGAAMLVKSTIAIGYAIHDKSMPQSFLYENVMNIAAGLALMWATDPTVGKDDPPSTPDREAKPAEPPAKTGI